MKYKPTIGLEIHAHLKTVTKLFCSSLNNPDEERPNVNICPICMGHPGTLPTLNKEAVLHILRLGVAIGGTLADDTEFDRKNYFYPDIPKGYQISQYARPLVAGGSLLGVPVTRIHLEEDTARSMHLTSKSSDPKGHSLIDFNRSGIPLMELVTEPEIHSAETAGQFARELQLLLRYLGAGEANMEKGEMRVEANISVSDDAKLGTKVEIKNLNSFRAVERAIDYEIKRHTELLNRGKVVIQETRGWNEEKQETYPQRLKEESHDYRYFPDPDIPKLKISQLSGCSAEVIKSQLPELPWEKRRRYEEQYHLKREDAEMFVRDTFYGDFFEQVVKSCGENEKKVQLTANYITTDLVGLYQEEGTQSGSSLTSKSFANLIEMIASDKVSSRGAKTLLSLMVLNGGDPEEIAESEGLLQNSDEEVLMETVSSIISDNPHVVKEYKGGKEASLQFLIGQGMKMTKGSANPQVLKRLLQEGIQKSD